MWKKPWQTAVKYKFVRLITNINLRLKFTVRRFKTWSSTVSIPQHFRLLRASLVTVVRCTHQSTPVELLEVLIPNPDTFLLLPPIYSPEFRDHFSAFLFPGAACPVPLRHYQVFLQGLPNLYSVHQLRNWTNKHVKSFRMGMESPSKSNVCRNLHFCLSFAVIVCDCPLVCMTVHLSFRLSLLNPPCPSVCMSVRPSICLPVCLSVRLSAYLLIERQSAFIRKSRKLLKIVAPALFCNCVIRNVFRHTF